jgi:hypothetical protein
MPLRERQGVSSGLSQWRKSRGGYFEPAVVSSLLIPDAMSDPQVAPFIVPEFDATTSIRDWHVKFATQNVASLSRLQAMTPGRVVLVMIDPVDPKPKVSFRTDQNVIALLPSEDADAVNPEKIVVVSYDSAGVAVATRFRINGDDPAAL